MPRIAAGKEMDRLQAFGESGRADGGAPARNGLGAVAALARNTCGPWRRCGAIERLAGIYVLAEQMLAICSKLFCVRKLLLFAAVCCRGNLSSAIAQTNTRADGHGPESARENPAADEELLSTADRRRSRYPGGYTASDIVEFDATGMADIEAGHAMQKDTIFQIMSMTKPVTAIGIMMLAEEGKLALRDPVEQYLPEFKGLRVRTTVGPDAARAERSQPRDHHP